jgi:hypothetical protein
MWVSCGLNTSIALPPGKEPGDRQTDSWIGGPMSQYECGDEETVTVPAGDETPIFPVSSLDTIVTELYRLVMKGSSGYFSVVYFLALVHSLWTYFSLLCVVEVIANWRHTLARNLMCTSSDFMRLVYKPCDCVVHPRTPGARVYALQDLYNSCNSWHSLPYGAVESCSFWTCDSASLGEFGRDFVSHFDSYCFVIWKIKALFCLFCAKAEVSKKKKKKKRNSALVTLLTYLRSLNKYFVRRILLIVTKSRLLNFNSDKILYILYIFINIVLTSN